MHADRLKDLLALRRGCLDSRLSYRPNTLNVMLLTFIFQFGLSFRLGQPGRQEDDLRLRDSERVEPSQLL